MSAGDDSAAGGGHPLPQPVSPSSAEICALFEAQKAGVVERRRNFGLDPRRDALRRLSETIKRREPEIVAALAQDFGKPEPEVTLTETLPVQQEISHALANLKRWMRPKSVWPSLATVGTSASIRPEPRGVCLIIAPWNFPFNLALGPLVSCLAAGNSAIIKPSEQTPATSALIATLIAETFPPEHVTVVEGGKDASEALLALPFDHIFFTGSPEVGAIVMKAAAEHLSSVTLELGGKSPTIIGPGADLDSAADWVTFGKFVNAGQTCIAPDHLFVHENVQEAFVATLRKRIAKAYERAPIENLARIVNDRHLDRLRGLIDDATGKGANLLQGGASEDGRLAPTLIDAITPDMRIDEEEIFGPVLPIIPYADLAEVIERINARPKPLALYVFEKDSGAIETVLSETSSGSVGVNLTLLQFSHSGLPFGGVNHSGIGAAHGEYGFRAFSHERSILKKQMSLAPLLFAPYTARKRRLLSWFKRLLG